MTDDMSGDDMSGDGDAAIMAPSVGIRHGGDLAAARAAFPEVREAWIDLSTGVNPWPYPVVPPGVAAWARLPSSADEQALRDAAAAYFGVDGRAAHIAIAPGTQALIQLLPRLRPSGRVAVLAPTYAEHAAAWRAAGHQVTEYPAFAAATAADADVVIVVNPNNPDGRVVAAQDLLAAADRQAARGGWLLADEAFADACPETSVVTHAGRPGLAVLRSFGKFFGLAGARLGFLLGEPGLTAAVARALGPWAVSGPALAVGRQAYQDAAWIAAARRRLAEAAGELDQLLTAKGYTVIGGTPLFRLVGCADGATLFRRLAAAGIWSRPFDNLPQAVRLGLPADAAARARLAAAL